jgi:predicted house-cleaning noncanonical NTP pyrophosphatase (MazG superfamily)
MQNNIKQEKEKILDLLSKSETYYDVEYVEKLKYEELLRNKLKQLEIDESKKKVRCKLLDLSTIKGSYSFKSIK